MTLTSFVTGIRQRKKFLRFFPALARFMAIMVMIRCKYLYPLVPRTRLATMQAGVSVWMSVGPPSILKKITQCSFQLSKMTKI